MAAAADSPYAAATDLAELLVRRGIPFRDAHAIVGDLVRRSLDGGIPLRDLVADEHDLGDDGVALLEPGVSVRAADDARRRRARSRRRRNVSA